MYKKTDSEASAMVGIAIFYFSNCLTIIYQASESLQNETNLSNLQFPTDHSAHGRTRFLQNLYTFCLLSANQKVLRKLHVFAFSPSTSSLLGKKIWEIVFPLYHLKNKSTNWRCARSRTRTWDIVIIR